jgi:TetR/AcrR family transcriptional regulator, transcriptional repressor of bet genes
MGVVARRGYTGATMPQVAAAAGLGAGLIHYHFQDKQELLIELLRHLRDVLRQRAQRRSQPTDDAPRALAAFLDAHLAVGEDADLLAVACWQVLGAEALHDSALRREYRRAVRDQLRELERILGHWPRLPRGEVPRVAAAILAAVQGHFSLAATNPDAIPAGSAATSVRQMAQGLLPPIRAGGRARKRRGPR